ncbi:MAG: hypothetical protein AAFY88_15360, partial [Acidobacteriota bacterium]
GPADGTCAAGGASASFAAVDENLQSLRAWLDGDPYAAGTPMADGVRSLRVLAIDRCGSASEEIRRFTVDSAAPVLDVVLPPLCAAGPVSATFSAVDADLLSVDAWLDGEPYTSGAPIGDGAHTLVVRATDACGNASEETYDFAVDSAPPVLEVDAPQGGPACRGRRRRRSRPPTPASSPSGPGSTAPLTSPARRSVTVPTRWWCGRPTPAATRAKRATPLPSTRRRRCSRSTRRRRGPAPRGRPRPPTPPATRT